MRDKDLWNRVQQIDLPTPAGLVLRTSGIFSGKPIPQHIKLEIISELRRFLYLLAISDQPLIPSHFVALALEQLLTSPSANRPLSTDLLGLTLTPTHLSVALQPGYMRAFELRADEFGAADPEHIWPNPRSMRLQLLGWASLAAGVVTWLFAQMGIASTGLTLILLLVGGFLWFTEGP